MIYILFTSKALLGVAGIHLLVAVRHCELNVNILLWDLNCVVAILRLPYIQNGDRRAIDPIS